MPTVDSPVGRAFLADVTTLLHSRRLASPDGEVWEAADLQWWWPRHPHDDPADAQVWRDDGAPIAAVVFTRPRTVTASSRAPAIRRGHTR